MFRKPKKSKKSALRKKRKEEDDEEGEGEESTSQLVDEARRATKKSKTTTTAEDSIITNTSENSRVMHQFEASSSEPMSAAELATSTAQHHPESKKEQDEQVGKGDDGIFRDKTRNKFLAGPLKASAFVRTTCRFDYQPDICKDYKETGFCGFGDTCIYLHDRGDTMTGWQLEQEWEDKKKAEQAKKEKQMEAFVNGTIGSSTGADGSDSKVVEEDGLPFACHICREAFTDPVITPCNHYFCEKCIMDHVRRSGNACPICDKDTHGVFNHPAKLLAKKRRLVGSRGTWEEFAKAIQNKKTSGEE
mmetsp:Transcript_18425/g.25982  ORF Transcript_18425/g.25982 Transcript_18425/m.25982 type:complete len:304 (-) Transcript_18425:140-1051(-)